jgi:effector-binding domain-containing protein
MSVGAVHVEQVEPMPLAVVRREVRQAELSRVVPECCGLVWQAVKAQKVPAGRHVAVYWDDVMHVDIGVELQGPFVDDQDVVNASTPGGTVAWVTHLGPYGGLGAAHDAIHRWCTANGRAAAGPSWEVYGHWHTAWNDDPSQIRTDVYYLLA